MKFEISLFKFDYKSDYLPYYTKHYLKIEEDKTLLDIFNTINEDHPINIEISKCDYVVVNEIYVNLETTCKELKSNFGTDLTIEPLSIRRACNDFIINEDDFNERIEVLADYLDDELKAKYNSYKVYFYASNTMNFQYDYIGDALLLLASEIIEKNPSLENEILTKLVENDYASVEYHTNLTPRILNFNMEVENKILSLKTKLNASKEFSPKVSSKINFGNETSISEIKHDFNNFVLAYYEGSTSCSSTSSLLDNLNAKVLKLTSLKQDLAKDSFHLNSNFTFKLASKVMLDAFDSGADLMVVNNENDFYLLDSYRKELYNACGRDVILPVVHKNELQMLAEGKHEEVSKLLKAHTINPEIV